MLNVSKLLLLGYLLLHLFIYYLLLLVKRLTLHASVYMLQIQARVENELYLRQHPEIDCLLTTFVRLLLL